MKTITIPDPSILKDDAIIGLYDYRTRESSNKQLINLTKNTFSFLIEGKKEVITEQGSISIDNAKFLLMQSGRCLMTEKLSATNRSYSSMLLFFSNEAMLQLIRKFDLSPPEKIHKQAVYSFSYDAFIRHYVQSLVELSKLSSNSQRNLLAIKFEEIMLFLVEKRGSDFLYAMLSERDEQSQKLIAVVESNKYNRLSLKELAFLTNMSVSSFKRAFVKQYATSPIKWFQDQRLKYAAFLLKQEQKRASDIYTTIGYETLSSFVQAFKSKYGVTPKQYQ
ncbi:MAG: AraC family transcriptional regulator [Bacteroidota bacterium]